MKKTIKQTKREDLSHFNGVDGRSVVVYVLKAHKNSIGIDDFANSIEREDTSEQYALGVYSRAEHKEMNEHAIKHMRLTGEYVSQLETFIKL